MKSGSRDGLATRGLLDVLGFLVFLVFLSIFYCLKSFYGEAEFDLAAKFASRPRLEEAPSPWRHFLWHFHISL